MRPLNRPDSTVRCGLLLGTLAMAGCVPSGFVYDLPQDRYYNSGGSYYSAGTPGYYGQPYYYGQPGQYPRIVYVEHDHDRDDCSHESHRDRRDAPLDKAPSPRAPRGVTPKDPAQTTEVDAPRRRTQTREGRRLVEQ